MDEVKEHVMKRTLHEIVITPDHVERTESPEFRKSKERLKADGHYKCWVCGTTDDLHAHHFGVEWSLANIADWDKVEAFVEEWDPYGYGRLLRNVPLEAENEKVLKVSEISAAIPYLDTGRKGMSQSEVKVLLAEGLYIYSVFETSQSSAGYFTVQNAKRGTCPALSTPISKVEGAVWQANGLRTVAVDLGTASMRVLGSIPSWRKFVPVG